LSQETLAERLPDPFLSQPANHCCSPFLNYAVIQYPVPFGNQMIAEFNTATPTSLGATIDGAPVPDLTSHLETSGVFSMGLAVPGTYGPGFETPGFPGRSRLLRLYA
jgi:hypothetical protein